MTGTLFIVATPIGNLEDLSPRAHKMLSKVSFIAAEDTRRTQRLLTYIGHKKKIISLHDFNEEKIVKKVIQRLELGENVAMVCDAGTPLINDPGFLLVCAAHENHIPVSPIPGSNAAIAALSVAGIPADRFCFEGFAPSKRTARIKWFEKLVNESRTIIIYEAVHRVAECLEDMVNIFGSERKAFIARELTKIYEQCVNTSLGELHRQISDGTILQKGEFVIVVSGSAKKNDPFFEVNHLLDVLNKYLSAKDAAKIAAEVSGYKRNILYKRILKLKN
ncbi:MAG: 16S rRNA (cytidine(1402)-2'-O)-methyltransferase [Gammaproteobacteria bacterium]|nr:16S rRNA (cytidine(1402)-2'-O)-methyltransferase [Gammaproteobacteria bacterium]|tara:strand:- start:5934 stop:6764 length:831 start_codon:yes stop_codon:yes gene_type:complete